MAKHNSFKVGGTADVYVSPASLEELICVVIECRARSVPFIILGHGSNVLVPDQGLRGVVIQLYPYFSQVYVDETSLYAQAGTLLSAAATKACSVGLSGMEFAAGIPGTVGGAVCMNAGAYGPEIKDICETVTLLMPDNTITIVPAKNMDFGYRYSNVQENGAIVVSATFALSPGDSEVIRAETEELNSRRRISQPLEYPSAGSTFKRPEGYYAGKLIEDCGLKGYSIGGAQVSEKHAGFVINTGNATAEDIFAIIAHIQETVFEQFGVKLEPEVKILCNS